MFTAIGCHGLIPAFLFLVLFPILKFDFVKLLDGKALPRSIADPVSAAKAPRGLLLNALQETGFIEYMDPGTWHLALYNDGRSMEQVLLHSTTIGECRVLRNDEQRTFFKRSHRKRFYSCSPPKIVTTTQISI